MKVFIVEGDPKFQSLTILNEADYARWPNAGGPPYADTGGLRSILFCRLVPFRRQGDFRSIYPFMTCSQAVFDRVRDTLQGDVQPLEITVDEEEQPSLLLYPTNILDAVDVDAVKRHWATGSTEMSYAFKPAAFKHPQMFTTEWFSPTVFYVTGLGQEERDFYLRCQQLKLTGMRFTQVWEA